MNAKAQNKALSNISGCLKNNVLFIGDCFVTKILGRSEACIFISSCDCA